MSRATDGQMYVLVIKDELTHYVELIACTAPTSSVAATGLMDWAKRFGYPSMVVSDQGSHFVNQLMQELRELTGINHRLAPVYTPCLNGAVERVNRDILQVARAMLIERRLGASNWPYILSLIQANLNQSLAGADSGWDVTDGALHEFPSLDGARRGTVAGRATQV